VGADDEHTDAQQGASANHYQRIVRLIAEHPWAILPSTLAAILELVALRAAGERLSEEEIQARVGAGPPGREPARVGPVAVLPLYGVIFPRANLFTEMSGGTSLQQFISAFRQAIGDERTRAVVLDVDSPGGLTDLVPEVAAEIRSARGSKPIVAIADTTAASAAYWLASQADELVVTPSGEVGSIGIFAAHDDISKLQEKAGVKTTLISAGRYKTEGNPFEPLSEEARQAIQRTVDEFFAMFVDDVAHGRRVRESAVRQGFGQGRMVTATRALELGMADRIDTFEATITRLAGDASGPGRRALALRRDAAVLEHIHSQLTSLARTVSSRPAQGRKHSA